MGVAVSMLGVGLDRPISPCPRRIATPMTLPTPIATRVNTS
jgi:hypothetical protein